MVRATDVSKYFLSLSKPHTSLAITPLKLQKLLYYAQGWHMGLEGKPLFKDELEAWTHGPVVPSIYRDYKYRGYLTIPKENFDNKGEDNKEILTMDQLELLNAIWSAYGEYDGKYLEQLTHQEDPWLDTDRNHTIKKEKIKEYFERRSHSV